MSDLKTAETIEAADIVINLGDALWPDFNTSGFTNNLDLDKVINLAPVFVETKDSYFKNVYLSELLDKLIQKVPAIDYKLKYTKVPTPQYILTDKYITLESLYNQISRFIVSTDNIVVETGSSLLNFVKYPLTKSAKYHNQTLWGSIGWATPAALGVALAQPDSRTILITGEGSHQLTLNDIGVMGRYNVNHIIICVNNKWLYR